LQYCRPPRPPFSECSNGSGRGSCWLTLIPLPDPRRVLGAFPLQRRCCNTGAVPVRAPPLHCPPIGVFRVPSLHGQDSFPFRPERLHSPLFEPWSPLFPVVAVPLFYQLPKRRFFTHYKVMWAPPLCTWSFIANGPNPTLFLPCIPVFFFALDSFFLRSEPPFPLALKTPPRHSAQLFSPPPPFPPPPISLFPHFSGRF